MVIVGSQPWLVVACMVDFRRRTFCVICREGVAERVALPNARYVKRKLSLRAAGSDCGHLAAPLFGRAVTHGNAFLNPTKHTEKITI